MKKIITILSIVAFVGVYSTSLFHFHKHSAGEACSTCELSGASCSDASFRGEAIEKPDDKESRGCLFCKLIKSYNSSAELGFITLTGEIHNSYTLPENSGDFISETVVHLPPRSPPKN